MTQTFSQNGHEPAALYTRVSTVKQLDNSSPETHLKRCREYADSRDYVTVTEKTEAIGGDFIEARIEFNELLDMATAGQISVIVVDIPDRLGRGDAIAVCEYLAREHGARIEYATPGSDKSTMEGFVRHSSDQMVSGIEKMNIARRTKEGRREFAQRGRVIASRYRPFGYDYQSTYDERGRKLSCVMVVREDEAATVRRIFEMCVCEGMTVNSIRCKLTDDKVPTPSETNPNLKRDMPGKWARSTIGRILSNPTYKGEWYYAKKAVKRLDTPDGVKQRITESMRADAIRVPVPAIVSEAMWEAAQEQLDENRRKFVKPAKYQYLLRGRIRCAMCGHLFIGHYNEGNGRFPSYQCGCNMAEYGEHRCKARRLNAAKVEKEAWGAVCDAILDEDRLLAGMLEGREEKKRARRVIEHSIAALEAQNEKAQDKQGRLLDLYTEREITKTEYTDKRREIEGEIERRNGKISKLAETLADYTVVNDEQLVNLRRFRAEIETRLRPDVPFEEKTKLLDILRVECVYDDRTGEMVVNGLFGSNTLSIRS